MSTQHILDVKNMTLDGKPLVINEEQYNFIFFMLSKSLNTNQEKKNVKSPIVPMINYNLYNILGDIFSPHFNKSADNPKQHNEKSDINVINLSAGDILIRKYIDYYFIDSEDLESKKNDPEFELNKPIKNLYTKNTTPGSTKPYMNIIMISNTIGNNSKKNKNKDDIFTMFNSVSPNITIYLYISDNFETSKLKVINNTKKLYKIFNSGLNVTFSSDGETIDYKNIEVNELKFPECPECKKCDECPECKKCAECPECKKCDECPKCNVCPDTKPYTYGLYGCAALIFILLIFLFYNIMKGNKETKPEK